MSEFEQFIAADGMPAIRVTLEEKHSALIRAAGKLATENEALRARVSTLTSTGNALAEALNGWLAAPASRGYMVDRHRAALEAWRLAVKEKQ